MALRYTASSHKLKAINGRSSPLFLLVSRHLSSSSALWKHAVDSAAHTQADDVPPLPFSSIPGPGGLARWPVLGAFMLFKPFTHFTAATLHQMFESLFKTYGPIVRIQMRGSTVLVQDVKDVETVFRNEGQYPVRPSFQLQSLYLKRNNMDEGFNEVQGEKWHELRAPLNKRLARVNSASYYLQQQNAVAEDFREILATGHCLQPHELADTFFRYAAESIGVVCFNTRLGFLDRDLFKKPASLEFLKASQAVFHRLQDELSGRTVLHGIYRNKIYRDFEAAQLTLKYHSERALQAAMNVLEEKQRNGTFDPGEPNLLFSLLSDPNIDFEKIVMLMNTLYITGTDSTAKNLQVFFYNLATHLEKQETLYKEISDVLGSDQPLTSEALTRMPYLKAAVKESFRMIFPVLGIARFMPKEIVLSGYRIPVGTQILICSHSVSKAHFDRHDQFNPERWSRSEQGKRLEANVHPMAILPFGYGPRNCIGRRFAEQEMFLAGVKILQKFRIGVKPESQTTRFTYTIFVEPEKPIEFTFTKR